MENLPPKIISEALQYVPKRDLKAVRMVSSKLCAISTQLLFRRAYASVHLTDLLVLCNIFVLPTISLAVREVVYCGVFFPTTVPE